jgi:hypothetical protein
MAWWWMQVQQEEEEEEEEEDEEEDDEYLVPLRKRYSALKALDDGDKPSKSSSLSNGHHHHHNLQGVAWTPIQMWRTMLLITRAHQHGVPLGYFELRDSVFGGNPDTLQAMLDADILSCRFPLDSHVSAHISQVTTYEPTPDALSSRAPSLFIRRAPPVALSRRCLAARRASTHEPKRG